MANDFSKVEAFASLDEDGLAALESAAKPLVVKGGDYLVRYGEEADVLYLVSTGRFYVQLPNGRVVAEIGAGEPVGELAFFAGGTRTADVRASRDSSVYALTREAYDGIVAKYPDIADAILGEVSARLARATAFSKAMEAKPGRVVSILPAAQSRFPEGFVERLCAAVNKYGEARLVTSADRPDGVPADSEAFGRWLGELERAGQRLMLVASGDEEWDKAIARNADDLVLVAPLNEENCEQSDLEKYAIPLFLRTNRTLILWREREQDVIRGSGRWIDDRRVKLHHQVPLDCEPAFERVARFLSGRANGVVLAGGGALGCAHIGVMQALMENDIPIDFYGGTSAGAAMALALAGDVSPEEVMDRIEHTFVEKRAMRRFTLPVFSFLDHTVFDRELSAHYGDRDLADLPINGFAVSTNLSRNRLHVHRTGPIWHAVRSSGAIPGVLPPFVDRSGEMFVDGALIDNLPLSTMRDIKLGPNVVAGFFDDESRQRHLRYDEIPGRERLIGDIVMRRRRTFPGILNVLTRSMMVTSRRSVSELEIGSDCLMRLPACKGMGMLDWKTGRAQEELCYQFACRRIEEAGGVDGLVEADA